MSAISDYTRRSVGISSAPLMSAADFRRLSLAPRSSDAPSDIPAPPAEDLGRFRVGEKLGEGGMARVFKAKDTLLGRSVALKVLSLPTDSGDLNFGLRFLREAEVLASMDHPNIVKIFDAGLQDGAPYLVLEFLAGEHLASRLRRKRRLALTETLEIMLPVLDAIEHAHRRGVLHLDLKPANVLLAEQDDKMVPKVLDFGVCSFADVEDDLDPTREDHAGTPAYMAPETLSGHSPSPAADVYSLAVMMYECLSGLNPFAKQSSLVEVKQSITERRYPKLPTLFPGCSQELAAVIAQAMSPKPAQRPKSPAALADALRTLKPTTL